MKHYFSRLLLMVMFIPWVLQAQTTPAPASLPYTCGFEDATENANWVIENGASATNKFFIDSAVNNGGTQSLYVSDNNGVSNRYTSSSAAAGYVYAYREFTITGTARYSIAFDWRAKGESTYDFLRVFLIPDNAADALTPSTGTSAHTGVTASASPASWIPIDNNVKLNLKDTIWQSFVSEDLQLTPGTYKLVFYWRTDASGTYDPPVAVDNVTFTEVTCPRPYNLAVTSLSNTSVTLSWSASNATAFAYVNDTANAPRQWNATASNVNDTTVTITDLSPNTAYTFYLQSLCSGSDTSLWVIINYRTECDPIPYDSLPYHESFESWATGAIDPCYVATNNHTSTVNYPSIVTTYSSDSAKSVYMCSPATYASWLAMPMFETPIDELQMSFDLYKTSVTQYPFMVGVMSDPNDLSTFDTITIVECGEASTWKHFTIPLSIYEGTGNYIAFVSPNGVASNNYLDNVLVEELPSCPDPINVVAYATSDQDITIAWTETGATGYIAEYGLMGFEPGTGSQEYGISDSINLYGLNPATAYDVYLRADCYSGDTGNWIGPITVRTACPEAIDISVNPYIENFDSYSPSSSVSSASANNELPSCWNIYSNGTNVHTQAYYPRIFRGSSYAPNGNNDNALTMPIYQFIGTSSTYVNYLRQYGSIKMATLPLVNEPLNNVTLTFDAKVYTVSSTVIDTIFVAIPTSDSTYIPLAHYEGISGLIEIEENLANYASAFDTIENPRIAIVFKACDYSSTTSGRYNYLGIDNVQIAVNNSCIRPYDGQITNVTATEATFSFADSVDVGNYEVTWATANDVLLAELTNTLTDTIGIIEELEPNTVYYAWVRSNCGSGYSDWRELGEFRTLCLPVDSLPYTEDFESYNTGSSGTFNTCWTKGTNYTTAYPYVSSYSNSKRLYFYSTASYYSYAALPLFTAPLNTLQVSFDLVKYSSYASDIVVGVMSNPQDINTFVAIDTLVPQGASGTINSYEISFETYTGLEGCIAFLSPISTGTDYTYLDSVVVSELPACRKSTELAASNVTTNSATLSWFNSTGDSYIVAYSRDADFDPDTCTTVVTTNADSVVVTGLLSYSNYYFAVKAICGTDNGAWSLERGHFVTLADCGGDELIEPVIGNLASTSTSSTYPFYSSTSYTRGLTWQIYTMEELGEQGVFSGNINSIAYQYTSAFPMSAHINVYMAEKESATFASASDSIALDSMTLVYSGEYLFYDINDWSTIIFDNPYNYSGTKNLVVAVERVGTSSYAGYFRYTAGVTGVYTTSYSYTNSSGSKYTYTAINRNNVKFNICNVVPPCVPATEVVVSNIQPTQADVAWDAVTYSNFTVAYGPRGFSLDSVGSYQTAQTATNSITLTGLAEGTMYDVYVRTNCNNDTAEWSFAEAFTTTCNPISALPYTEDFDSYTTDVATALNAPTSYPDHAMPSCWSFLNLSEEAGSNYPQAFLTSSTTYALSGNCLFFKSKMHTSIFSVLPKFDANIDTLMISFTYRNEGTTAANGTLSLGVMTDITDTASFIELEVFDKTSTKTRIEHIFTFDSLSGTNYTIAFRYQGSTSNNMYLGIDSVVVDYVPSCLTPINLANDNTTETSTEISWNSTSATSWLIEYGPAGFEPGEGTVIATNSNPYTLTGLRHSTRYDVYVRSICNNGDTSGYQLYPLNFRTACGIIDSLPWTADLDGTWYYYTNNTTTLFPSCWDVIDNGYISGTTHYSWRRSTTASYIRTGNAAIQFAGYASTSATYEHDDYLITPEMQLTGNEQLVFWMRNSTSSTSASYTARVAIYAYTVDPNDTVENYVQVYPRITMLGGENVYTEHIVPLTGLTGNVKLAFVVDTNSYSFYIDDVVVEPIPSCPKPRFLSVIEDSTTTTSISLTWRNAASEFIVDYKKGSDSVWSSVTGIQDTVATITGLTHSTTYQFRVKAVCMVGDTSVWSEIIETPTACGSVSLPFYEDFSTSTFPAYCWNIYTGIPFSSAAITSTTGIWTRATTDYGLQTPHAKINIYGTSRKHWLVTPEIDLANENGAELTFDIALTDYNNGDTIKVDESTADDKFMVIISRDGGNTWLRENATVWSDLESDSADYSFRSIRRTGEHVSIDLSQYYGDTIRIAFYGESTITGGDNDLHIDNILVQTGCPAPAITSTTYDATTATIAWTSSSNNIQVAYREATATDWNTPVDITNATTYTFTGLTPETDYVLGVRALCEEGAVSGWATTTITTPELPCIVPTNVTATDITYTSANIGWTASGNEVSWEVRYATGGQEDTIVATTNPVAITGLFSASTYQVWVRAFCGADTYSEWSEVYTFNTQACATVSNVVVSEIGGNNATVTWTPAEGQTAWEVSYGMQGFSEGYAIATVTVTNPTYQMTGLETDSPYDVYVRAICDEDVYSAWSTRVTFTTTEDECESVSNVTANNITENSATITWTPAGNETKWQLAYDLASDATTVGEDATIVDVENTPSYTITGLEIGTSYDAFVRTVCSETNYSAWVKVNFTTENGCGSVSNVTANDITETSATITWTPAGNETKWQVAYCLASDATTVGEDATIIDVENTPSYTITGLETRTSYDAFVRTVCNETIYSAWVKVNFTTLGIGINTAANDNVSVRIYPNPANTQATISVEGVNGKVEFVVADMNGRMIVTETIDCNGELVKTIDVSNLAKGAYFVHIYNDNINTTRKLIVK